MKRNNILGCILFALVLCFGFACKHTATSQTLATPEEMKEDCIRYAGLNVKPGLIEEYEGVLYWDMDRVIQFASGDVDRKGAYDYLVNGKDNNFYLERTRDQSTIVTASGSILVPLEAKCKQLKERNKRKYAITALFVEGTQVDGRTTCRFDLWSCDDNFFVRSYVNKKTEYAIKDFLKPECYNLKSNQIGFTRDVNKAGMLYKLHFDRPFNTCFSDPLYIFLDKTDPATQITSQDVVIYEADITDEGIKISNQIKTLGDLLEWKVSGTNRTIFRQE